MDGAHAEFSSSTRFAMSLPRAAETLLCERDDVVGVCDHAPA